ncbi:MAG TPA: hypothetical protein VMV10_13745 [Pirellulales bacterium]|nr:hypothetical protein [Pirellulales bacterium]
MPKQAKKPRKRNAKQPRSRETRSTDALTIGWMLMVFTALVCEIAFMATRGFAGADSEGSLAVLTVVLLLASVVIGLGVLLLTPVVIKIRRDPPPRAIIIFSVVVGIAPWALIVFQMANS